MKALLRAGADPRRQLEGGETAAIVSSDRDISQLLYEAERDLFVKEKMAEHLATQR